jgi:hypothetical protein
LQTNSKTAMIPDTNRSEWANLITGLINPQISSLTLQLKLNSLKLDLKLKHMDLKTAIADLHKFCLQHEQMIQKDINKIFSLS